MSFLHDIRGDAWQPCGACPHPTPGACPSRRLAGLCGELEKSPEAWAPVIAAMPPEERPAVFRECIPTPPPPPPPPPEGCGDDVPPEIPPETKDLLAIYEAKRQIVFECDYRGDVSLCGCVATRVCLKGRGKIPLGLDGPLADVGDVTMQECLECISTPEA